MSIPPKAAASRRQIQHGPAVWRTTDVLIDRSWEVTLTDGQRSAIVAATHAAVAAGQTFASLDRANFPLPSMMEDIQEWSEQLRVGRGFLLLRGFPIELFRDEEEIVLAYAGLGSHLGRPVGQNAQGDLLTHVRDERIPASSGKVRLYRTRERQDFHTDAADIIGLLCLHEASSGGASKLASSWAIYNEMLVTRPDLLDALYEPVGWDRQGDVPNGEQPWFVLPPLTDLDGVPRLFYVGWYIRESQQHADAPQLQPRHLEAMEMLERLANDPTFHIEMVFEQGDVQFLNNGRILHAREAYEDHDEMDARRHLLRLWLAAHTFESVDPELRCGIAPPRTEILFVCVHNAGRSQMAAALLHHHGGDRVVVRSAGTAPAAAVNPVVVQAMAEVGIDLLANGAQPKRLEEAAVRASDIVITMGCGDQCPFFPGVRYLDWPVDDPAGLDIDAIRPIRNAIERRVLDLLTELP